MEAKDLMIGDWMQFANGNKKCMVVCIKCDARLLINEATITVMDSSGLWFEKTIDELKPISLTSKILGKNGFVANTHVYPYPYYEYINEENKLKIGFAFPQGNKTSYKEPWVYIDSEYVFIEHLPCIYIHQLQHVLKLCGIEKNIEL